MSSTKRGRARNRHDTYPTPGWAVRRLLEAVELPNGRWLEPCAGDGAIIAAVNGRMDPTKIEWEAHEIRKAPIGKLAGTGTNVDAYQGDFLELADFMKIDGATNREAYAVAITNPPFLLAMEFIDRCRFLATHTVMLLRLNFLASEKRADFMRTSTPDVYVLPNRPSFIGGGKTDSIEYAWFHWWPGAEGKLTVLASTDKLERVKRRRRT